MLKILKVMVLIFILLFTNIISFADETTDIDLLGNETIENDLLGEESPEIKWLEDEATEDVFTDVNQGEWYYEAVMTMNKYGIISGYGDGTFKPMDAVSREEFAAMMVRALKLELKESTSSFVDISDEYWASPYIEAAKNYITGYKLNGEFYFKPKEDAVREDMAVSLIRALNKEVGGESSSALEEYADKDDVSINLYDYVASAIYNNLMIGYLEDDVKYFKPMDTLTRAQAAALLLSVVEEEKIVFDEEVEEEPVEEVVVEEEVVIEDQVALDIKSVDGGLKLTWNAISENEILEYVIIASKNNEAPQYIFDGYAKTVEFNSTIIYNGDSYKNGDFTKFMPEEEYYFTVVGVTKEEEITSNVIVFKMPEAIDTEGKVPEVKVSQLDTGILVEWNDIDTMGLQGYKVVASKYDETPAYPDNGYAAWITDLNEKSYYIEQNSKYNGGDFGGIFKSGETYYITVIAVYNFGKVAGNSVTYIMPGSLEGTLNGLHRKPIQDVTLYSDIVISFR